MKAILAGIVVALACATAILSWRSVLVEPSDEPRAPAQGPAPTPAPRPQILVFAKDLLKGSTMTPADVVFREIANDIEMETFLRDRHRYVEQFPEVVRLRVLARDCSANAPVKWESFEDGYYETVVRPHIVAIQVSAEQGKAIAAESKVDVHLTASICANAECSETRIAAAPIAKDLLVVGARTEGSDVVLFLQSSAVRAERVDFAKKFGTISVRLADGRPPLADDLEKLTWDRELETILGAPIAKRPADKTE